jgi:hypothetical protein
VVIANPSNNAGYTGLDPLRRESCGIGSFGVKTVDSVVEGRDATDFSELIFRFEKGKEVGGRMRIQIPVRHFARDIRME